MLDPATMENPNVAQRERFDRLYSDWHIARAAVGNPDLPEDDASMNSRVRRLEEAQRALLTTPAPADCCVFQKWECLEQIMSAEAETGANPDNRSIVGLACIKADVLRFLGDPGDR